MTTTVIPPWPWAGRRHQGITSFSAKVRRKPEVACDGLIVGFSHTGYPGSGTYDEIQLETLSLIQDIDALAANQFYYPTSVGYVFIDDYYLRMGFEFLSQYIIHLTLFGQSQI